MATIVAITEENDHPRLHKYLLQRFIPYWEAHGHRVLFHHGDGDPPAGDVAILHVDRTSIPETYTHGLAQYARVINGAVLDIGKRCFSAQLLRPGESYAGPVICKTDLNCGGAPERRKHLDDLRRDRSPAGWCRLVKAKLENRLMFSVRRTYRVYDSVADVPQKIWHDAGRVVEKFLPEQDAQGYYLRTWLFFGDRESCSRVRSAHPVIKGRRILDRAAAPVPDELRAWRARLGFDYGKFDFAVRDGEVVLYDVNRTPTVPAQLQDAMQAIMADLAAGLDGFLK